MAIANDAEPRRGASGSTSDHSPEMIPSQPAETRMGFNQVSPALVSFRGETIGGTPRRGSILCPHRIKKGTLYGYTEMFEFHKFQVEN